MASDEYAEAIEAVWAQMPGPRAQLLLSRADSVTISAALDAAANSLLDSGGQRGDATTRDITPPELGAAHSDPGDEPTHGVEMHDADAANNNDDAMNDPDENVYADGHGHTSHAQSQHDDTDQHPNMDHDRMDHGGMDHGGMDHGGMDHGGMDHGAMDMEGPGGIALAAGGPDRDGLSMDVLHVRLGPLLTLWPAGLIMRLSLQGDVVTEASVDQTPPSVDLTGVALPAREAGAKRCDVAKDVLMLAGADRAAALARRARDLLLDPTVPADRALDVVEFLQHQIRRSRLLRWSLRGLAPVEHDGVLSGDVHDRLQRLLILTLREIRIGYLATTDRAIHTGGLDLVSVLPGLLVGTELSTARLAVASVVGFHHVELLPSEATHG
ncbi:MAG: hypothetical protein M3529_12340 [Actinomycetota bacterium]|nr:hypothetical protein [Actinomycetota bacterium]